MAHLLWDASALVKRYKRENGTETVTTLFEEVRLSPLDTMVLTFSGYSETYAILRRGLNSGFFGPAGYQAARSAMEAELLQSADFAFLSISDSTILASLPLIDRHNLNSSDACILAAYLDFRVSLSPNASPCVLIASDHRLLRAAQAERLTTLDPEVMPAADVAAFLSAL